MAVTELIETEPRHSSVKSDRERYLDAFLSMVKSKMFNRKPFLLAHAITYGCNSRCKTRRYWQMTRRMREDMTTPEVFELLDEAYDLDACRFPRMFVYVSADRKIFSCRYDHTYDLKKGSFREYFSSSL